MSFGLHSRCANRCILSPTIASILPSIDPVVFARSHLHPSCSAIARILGRKSPGREFEPRIISFYFLGHGSSPGGVGLKPEIQIHKEIFQISYLILKEIYLTFWHQNTHLHHGVQGYFWDEFMCAQKDSEPRDRT
jgi:hypothetical protein